MVRILKAALCLVLLSASCGHFPPAPVVVSCVESVGKASLDPAIAAILDAIESGAGAAIAEAEIISRLEALSVKFAVDVWQCAMQQVAGGKSSGGRVHASFDAVVAADYLAKHPSVGK